MEQLIQNFGFPVACVIGVSLYFVQKDKANREDMNKIIENMRTDAKEDRDMYRDTVNKFSDKLDKFGSALDVNNCELNEIKYDIEKIKTDIENIKNV